MTLRCKALDELGFTKHCFTTRLGGVSRDHLYSMNLSFSRESKENVEENYRRIKNAVGFSGDFALTSQQHTDTVLKVDSVHSSFETVADSVDGFITDKPDIILTVFVADCVPVIIVDPVNRAVACVHSGWRGTAMKITRNAVLKMIKEYGSDPKTLVAAIGPCINVCCYEVGQDVYDEFCKTDSDAHRFFNKKTDGKYMLDLNAANEEVLKKAGLLTQNIHVSNECTCCKNELYFSHRATKGKRGNIAAMIEL